MLLRVVINELSESPNWEPTVFLFCFLVEVAFTDKVFRPDDVFGTSKAELLDPPENNEESN